MSRAGWSSAQRAARRGSWQNTHGAPDTLAKVRLACWALASGLLATTGQVLVRIYILMVQYLYPQTWKQVLCLL